MKTTICVLSNSIYKRAFWAFVIIAGTCAVLFYQRSYSACAELAVFLMIGLFALSEEYNDPDQEPASTAG